MPQWAETDVFEFELLREKLRADVTDLATLPGHPSIRWITHLHAKISIVINLWYAVCTTRAKLIADSRVLINRRQTGARHFLRNGLPCQSQHR